jgi:hypothetical protein
MNKKDLTTIGPFPESLKSSMEKQTMNAKIAELEMYIDYQRNVILNLKKYIKDNLVKKND